MTLNPNNHEVHICKKHGREWVKANKPKGPVDPLDLLTDLIEQWHGHL